MNSGNNGRSTAGKILIGAVLALAAVILILFAAGGLDGFFSADDPINDDNSLQSVSDNAGEVNGTEGSENAADISGTDILGNSESVSGNISEPDGSAESDIESSGSSTVSSEIEPDNSDSVPESAELHFRNAKLLEQHYQKHGIDMGFASAVEYEKAAAAVVNAPDVLHKTEAEDGDDVYYIERTNEFVVVSTDGYLRTYFNPDRGKGYFDRQ